MNTQEQARFNMVEQQIRPWQVLDKAVLNVLSHVQRELFVPQAYQALAYTDTEIPLGHGQSMVPPRVDARLMHDLHLTGTEKVLEIGTGSGYLAALLAGRAQRVVSLEINPELAATARANLQRAGITNVDVRVADGSAGASGEAPFDAIVLGGSVAEVPQALLQQGLRHFCHGATEHDGVERGITRGSGAAVSHAHIHVGDASALQLSLIHI